MKRYAVINNDNHTVKQVIIYDGEAPWQLPDNHYLLEHESVDAGDIYDPLRKEIRKFYDVG